MLGSKKRQIQTEGAQAIAVVTDVEYAKVLGSLTIARNYNYKLDLTLMVRPDDAAPFEAHLSGYFPQFGQPSVGDQIYVRYDPKDPTHVEIDEQRIEADNAAAQASVVAAAAAAPPEDLVTNGIPGRATLVDVQKTPAGSLVDCALTVSVRLIDGTSPYRASCHVPLSADTADKMIPGQTVLTVRADPNDHDRVAVSLSEPTPVVTVTDPSLLEPSARALREGVPCRVVVLQHQQQWLKTPQGDEFYAVKVRVTSDGSEFQVNLPVPPQATALMTDGTELPAKRLEADPNVLMVDWAAALQENPVSAGT